MFIVKNKKIFIGISVILVSLSIFSIFYFGLNFGIDFKGGSLLEVEYENGVRQEQVKIEDTLKSLSIGSVLVQPIGDYGYSIKARDINDQEKNLILEKIGPNVKEIGFNSIGPSVGAELVRKSIICFILVSLGIIFWIAYSFRKVSKVVSSWKYGVTAVVALIHDVLIATGIFSLVSYFLNGEVDTLFVVAILTVLGISVSDTIVIFDRIRENLRMSQNKTFEEIVGYSIQQIYPRSIATSLTVIFALVSLVIFGPDSTKMFAITLTAGMFFGTYSSIFLASPLLIMIKDLQKKER